MRFARRSQLEENDIMRCRTVDEKNRNELNCMTVQKPLKRQVVCNEVRLVVNDQTQQVAYRVIDAPAPFAAERGFVDTYGIAAYRKGRKLCQKKKDCTNGSRICYNMCREKVQIPARLQLSNTGPGRQRKESE